MRVAEEERSDRVNKFYNFKSDNESDELYLYGAIVSDKWDDTEVDFMDFKNAIENLKSNTLNIYVNSPGGDVFTTSSIVSFLQRAKDKGITINAYIDGLGASCSSWLPMISDNVYIYEQSVLMIHKPMSFAYGNSNELAKTIEILDKLEDEVIIPLYMKKCKKSKEEIKNLIDKESWFTSKEIADLFDVTLLSDERKIACCVDDELFKKYKNVPKSLLEADDKVKTNNKVEQEADKLRQEKLNNINKELELIKAEIEVLAM